MKQSASKIIKDAINRVMVEHGIVVNAITVSRAVQLSNAALGKAPSGIKVNIEADLAEPENDTNIQTTNSRSIGGQS